MTNAGSKHYHFKYADRIGSNYSSTFDYRRFVTMDYNLESYVGIMGVGIIEGWTIETVSGLTIKILPGRGIINGFAVESQYEYKQRSDMVSGDREVEEVHDTDTVEPYLTPAQRATYIAVVQEYDPTFNPPLLIENAFVKTVVPTQMVLPNNYQGYIVAKRLSADTPYPVSADYPISTMKKPNAASYRNYAEYQAAIAEYNAEIQLITNYHWRANVANHFNAVEFSLDLNYSKSDTTVLLARIITAAGEIVKIDTSRVDSLANMSTQITATARDFLSQHQHGGSKYYDPPKIKLKTDIRTAALRSYDSASQSAVFNILENEYPGLELGHQHTYYIDDIGNGFTVGQIGGTTPSHFHKIAGNVMGSQELTLISIESHSHSISQESSNGWTSDSPFNVYINDIVFGDENSSNIVADSVKKTLTVVGGLGTTYRTYTTSFTASSGETFTYLGSAYSVMEFMIQTQNEYNAKYGVPTASTVDSNPFVFAGDTTGTFYGFSELYDQSLIAQTILKDQGDVFTFTPKAAKNITITLVSSEEIVSADDYDVKIEIMGNTEVSGILNAENILYVKASSIKTGTLDIVRIPFLSHVGRMGETVLPFKYPLISTDGIRYTASPAITTVVLEHYHRLFLDSTNSGVTSQTYISEDPVYYATGTNSQYYLIDHIHGVQDSRVMAQNSSGLISWQQDIHGSNAVSNVSSGHTHDVIIPVIGNPKIIYSVKEGADGTIYAGTSSGLYIIPQSEAYLFVVNNYSIYLLGSDLWALLLEAKSKYEEQSGNELLVTTEIYGQQITDAYSSLLAHNDAVLLYGYTNPKANQQDLVMIERLDYFEMPNFRYSAEKVDYEVRSDETIVASVFDKETEQTLVTVEKYLGNIPIWSLEIGETASGEESITAVGSKAFTYNTNIEDDFYKFWTSPDIPYFAGSLKKCMRESNGDIWVAASGGLLVSRYYQEGKSLESVTQPGVEPNVNDIVEGETGSVYCATNNGIYKTNNSGGSWTKIFSDIWGVSQVLRDYTKDKSTTVFGHYHALDVNILGNGITGISIGAGVPHFHSMSNWIINNTLGHTHTIIVELYAITNNGNIYCSYDNGSTWAKIGEVPTEEHSNLFAYKSLLVSKSDGLYKLEDGEWNKIFDTMVYSFGLQYDFDELLLGCNGYVYSTSDLSTFSSIMQLDGKQLPALYKNETAKNYGYAYSSKDNSFHFDAITYSSENSFALVDFGTWLANEGIWKDTSKYDIYIDDKIVLSSKKMIDNRSTTYSFSVNPCEGTLDFGFQTNVLNKIKFFDDGIDCSNTASFSAGDKICIRSSFDVGDAPVEETESTTSEEKQTLQENLSNEDREILAAANAKIAYLKKVADYQYRVNLYGNMYFYGTIASVSTNRINLVEHVDKDISLPAKVYLIPDVDGQTEIKMNIYESPLSNIGTFSHDELEDKLSLPADGRPYLLNNTYLSNLLQLTQAVKYIYPAIDSEFKNTNFYDFHYSWLTTDPVYPYIGDYVDLFNSEIHNYSLFTNQFSTKGAKKINRVVIGSDDFAGNIMVATDIGIFWAKIENGLEGDWFYVEAVPYTVYDIKILGDKLFAATLNGTYVTSDMITWQLQNHPAIRFPSTRMELRWSGGETVSIPAHTATFSNGTGVAANTGSIVSTSNVYGSLVANRLIEISNAGSVSGSYTIKKVLSEKRITTVQTFPITTSTIHNNVTMKMGEWWEYFSGSQNLQNTAFKNPLLVGGRDRIAYCANTLSNASSLVWNSAAIPPTVSAFQVSSFGIIDNGLALSSAISEKQTNVENYILQSSDSGNSWTTFKIFSEVRGTITNSSITDFNHTVLTVSFSSPLNYQCVDGSEGKKEIAVFKNGETAAIYRGKILWNEYKGKNLIYVYGTEMNTICSENRDSVLSFITYPIKINDIFENYSTKEVLYGTDMGIYSDEKSTVLFTKYDGGIVNTGIEGIVSKIDIGGAIGSIKSIYQNKTNNNTMFSITIDEAIGQNSLVKGKLHITDFDPIVTYDINSNTGSLINGEIAIEIDEEYSTDFDYYAGKQVTVVRPTFSRIFVTFSDVVKLGQFNGGKIYISSSGSNYGKEYSVANNTDAYIDVTPQIVPSPTTLVQSPSVRYDLRVGQNIKIIDASEKIELFVFFGEDIEVNQLVGMTFRLNTGTGLNSATEGVIINSNTQNKVVLINPEKGQTTTSAVPFPLQFKVGDQFKIYGNVFNPLRKFNNSKTSIEIDHYHNTNTAGSVVSGKIGSFIGVDASYVDIGVIDTVNFDTAVVQFRGDLFKDAKIDFYNLESIRYRFETEVVSHTPTSIRVKLQSQDIWNFLAYDKTKISTNWRWKIIAYDYGYTSGTYYDDFTVLYSQATSDILLGEDTIHVESTSGMVAGDKIRIIDGEAKSEIDVIEQVVDATTIKTVNPVNLSFYKVDSPVIKVLRNTFSNNHIHQIRNNQIETLYISQYLDLGYNSFHSHEVEAWLPSVSKLLKRGSEIIAIGSSGNIFSSYNNGVSWKVVTDLNRSLESSDEITGLTDVSLDDNSELVVGSDNGYVACEALSTTIVKLEKPSI